MEGRKDKGQVVERTEGKLGERTDNERTERWTLEKTEGGQQRDLQGTRQGGKDLRQALVPERCFTLWAPQPQHITV
jgi:hypothetical protein